MTKVAVVGVGRMGRNHARVYHEMPETDLVAVVDQSKTTGGECGRMYNVPAYQDLVEMVEKERPQAVSVVVPTRLHYQIVEQLLSLGVHVLVEKPIASTLDDARRMVALAESQDLVLMVGHIERFNPAVIELKRRLQQGELGRVFQVHARRLGPFPDRIQDVGCSLRAFYRECVDDTPVFRGMHRFLPTLVRMRGFHVQEVPVSHRPRPHGQTKYGVHNRLWVGIVDLFGVLWLLRRGTRPEVDEVTRDD